MLEHSILPHFWRMLELTYEIWELPAVKAYWVNIIDKCVGMLSVCFVNSVSTLSCVGETQQDTVCCVSCFRIGWLCRAFKPFRLRHPYLNGGEPQRVFDPCQARNAGSRRVVTRTGYVTPGQVCNRRRGYPFPNFDLYAEARVRGCRRRPELSYDRALLTDSPARSL
jgi:hypothetical protein